MKNIIFFFAFIVLAVANPIDNIVETPAANQVSKPSDSSDEMPTQNVDIVLVTVVKPIDDKIAADTVQEKDVQTVCLVKPAEKEKDLEKSSVVQAITESHHHHHHNLDEDDMQEFDIEFGTDMKGILFNKKKKSTTTAATTAATTTPTKKTR